MNKRIPKNKEERLKLQVVGYAINVSSQYDFLGSKHQLYEDSPYPWKKTNDLVNLFRATDELTDFLDYFPIPKQTNVREIKDIELRKLFIILRDRERKLENMVLRKSIIYCSNPKPKKDDTLFNIEIQLFDAVESYLSYLQWKKNFNVQLKKVQWIRNY